MTLTQHEITDAIMDISTGKTAVERAMEELLTDCEEWEDSH